MIKRYTLHDLRYIFIGRVGERNALTVDIDLSGWLSMFPDGDLELRLSLPDGSVFVPDIERTADGHLLWTVGETETAEAGNIAAQLVLLSDGVIAMTFVFECDVLPSGAPMRPVTHVTPPITDIRLTDSDSEADYYTITCADGSTFSFMVRNGKDGQNGADGKDGASGKDGAKGDDGVSPSVSFTPIEGGWRLTITDAEGEHSADLKPILLDPAAAVVQEKGESTTAVMSQDAVTKALSEVKPGWSEEAISKLETAVGIMETMCISMMSDKSKIEAIGTAVASTKTMFTTAATAERAVWTAVDKVFDVALYDEGTSPDALADAVQTAAGNANTKTEAGIASLAAIKTAIDAVAENSATSVAQYRQSIIALYALIAELRSEEPPVPPPPVEEYDNAAPIDGILTIIKTPNDVVDGVITLA